MGIRIDITGKKFGKLVAKYPSGKQKMGILNGTVFVNVDKKKMLNYSILNLVAQKVVEIVPE
ncbi:hypothetical protein ACF0HX_01025 [Pediococcus pentosaceus]